MRSPPKRRSSRLLSFVLTVPGAIAMACNGLVLGQADSNDSIGDDASSATATPDSCPNPSTIVLDAGHSVVVVTTPTGNDRCVLTPGPATTVDCNAATHVVPPPQDWPGGYYQGTYFPPGNYTPDAGLDAAEPIAVRACGCADLGRPFTSNKCSVLRQFPCGVFPIPTNPFGYFVHGDKQTVEECSPYCPLANCRGQPLFGCRGVDTVEKTGAPALECLYKPDPSYENCECADVPPPEISDGSTLRYAAQFPCELIEQAPPSYAEGGLTDPSCTMACGNSSCLVLHDENYQPYVRCSR